MAATNPFQLDDPNAILTEQNQQITSDLAGQGRGTPLSQYGAGLGQLFSRFIGGNPAVEKARNIQNANAVAQAGLAPQGDSESDVDYAIRSARAMHDAVAPYDSNKAGQILDHIVTLNQQKTQQSLLNETLSEKQNQLKTENLLSKGSYVVGTADGSNTFWRGDVLNPDGSLNAAKYQEMQDALKANPQAIRQTEENWATNRARVAEMQGQSRFQIAQLKAAQSQDPLDPETLSMAAADVRANGRQAMGQYAGYGQAGQARRDQINAEVARGNKELGLSDTDMIAYRAQVKANAGTIGGLQKFASMLTVNASLAHNNGDRIIALSDQVNPSKWSDFNALAQYVKTHTGDANAAEFLSVANTFQTEAARIIAGSPSGAGVLSDTARHELQSIVDGTLAPGALKRVIERLYTEFDVKRGAYKQQMQELAGGISNVAAGGSPYVIPPPAGGGGKTLTYDPTKGTFQ
jgi:hypothetical protein